MTPWPPPSPALWHTPCLPGLAAVPDGAIDAVVTSPPYNLGNTPSAREHPHARRGSGLDWRGYDGDGDDLPEDDYQAGQVAVLGELHRVLQPGGSCWYVHTDRLGGGRLISPLTWLARTPFYVRQAIPWDKGRTHRLDGHHFPPRCEAVYWLTKGPIRLDAAQRAMIRRWPLPWHITQTPCPWHPAPFPAELARRCLLVSTAPGDLVLDPYAGSCTVGAVAVELGRRFVGMEKQAAYIGPGLARITQPIQQALPIR